MPRYYRFSGRRYRRYRRYRRFYRRYRGRKRAINATSRSRIRVKIPAQFQVKLKIPEDQHDSNVATISPLACVQSPVSGSAVWRGGLLNAPLYTTYSLLYDEMKLEGMKTQIAITSPVGTGAGAYKSLQLYTAFDRKMCYDDMLTAHYPSVAQLKNYSSYIAATALNNNIAKVTRSIYGSDLFEKASFADASPVTLNSVKISTGSSDATYDVLTLAGNRMVPLAAGNQMTITGPAFNPLMYIGVSAPSDTGGAGGSEVLLLIDIMYYVTFRNPKFGAAAGNAKIAYEERSAYSMDADDGDMDEDAPVLVAAPAADANDGGDMEDDPAPASAPADNTRAALRTAERARIREKTMDNQRQKRSAVVVPGPLRKN